jgi:predicted ArsR family transcriptional regulator
MIFPLLRDLLPSPVWEMIQYLKHSSGLTIQELSELMDMSYMGVKKHCDAMVSKGYLDTWRRSQSHGRPEKVYRLTDKLVPLFPGGDNGLLREMLGHAERVFDPSAAEKLIYAFFQNRFERYAGHLNWRVCARPTVACPWLK